MSLVPGAEREAARRSNALKTQGEYKTGAPPGMAFDAGLARRLLESAAWTGEFDAIAVINEIDQI
jgi:hypothetical protein